MKELSIEEKAQRYDEAIEIAREINNEQQAQPFNIMTRVFPELKESEDEKIRKDLINYFNGAALEHREEEVLAWLEKQDEQKPVDSTLEIKPKFKVGDTIRELETGNLFYVNSVEDFGYTLHYKNCNANGCTMSFKYEDKYELIEQKPAWSEEDTKELDSVFSSAKHVLTDDNKKWLQSLKDRYTWKPSDEQMKALEHFVRSIGESSYASPYDNNTKLLYSLLSDLKKLKE